MTGVVMLQENFIKKLADDEAFSRGKRYYNEGRVINVKRLKNRSGMWFGADVQGASRDNRVAVKLSGKLDRIEDYECDCPAARRKYLGACKHIVAVLLELAALNAPSYRNCKISYSSEQLFKLFASSKIDDEKIIEPRQGVHLVPRLFVTQGENITSHLEFRCGMDKLYVVRDIGGFIIAKEKKKLWWLGNNETNLGDVFWADEVSEKLYAFIEKYFRMERDIIACRTNFGDYYPVVNSYLFDKKAFNLPDEALFEFFNIMGDMSFELKINDAESEDVKVDLGELPLKLVLQDNNDDGRLRLITDDVTPLDNTYRSFYSEGKIYIISQLAVKNIMPLIKSFAASSKIDILADDLGRFFSNILPRLESVATVDIAPKFLEKYQIRPLGADLYLDYAGDGIAVRPIFYYGEVQFNPLTVTAEPSFLERKLVRDLIAEQNLMSRFFSYGFTAVRDQLLQLDESKSYDFLTNELPRMPDFVEILYAESFAKKPVRRLPQVTTGVSVSSNDLLKVTFSTQDIDVGEMLGVLSAYRQKRRYFRLKDKTFLTLKDKQLQSLSDFADSIGITKKNINGKEIELPLYRAMYIDERARTDKALHLERSQSFKAMLESVRRPENTVAPVPNSLKNILRDYQVTGFSWLMTLANYHLGGILADDMGLGKTLQVIAFLLAKRAEQKNPSLVVVPTSLVYNWQEEIKRFAPELSILVIAGNKDERTALLMQADTDINVVITTYNMLKNDISLYEKRHFSYVFLDEAQHIKNPNTQAARAVKKLKAGGYFALTGTPIENTLTELWSLFDFLMPGYLYTHKKFKSQYETAIVRAEDKEALQDLKQHIMPFILRRMKKDVLTELPDKVERKMINVMTAEQEKVYKAWFIQSQKEFSREIAQNGFGESRIKILAILMRLRQIACNPQICLEGYTGGSGKINMLEEVVTDAVSSGHRLLIFSQFTMMLKSIETLLEKHGLDYFYLDGKTPSKERIRLVNLFNEGKVPLFLISLKAGGTGLNLTGADMVIHFDPWWNPAVEEQATDRAYRLGQKNNVQVLKFITKDTIEEKIYELQEKKKSLIGKMIQPNAVGRLTEEEVRSLFKIS